MSLGPTVVAEAVAVVAVSAVVGAAVATGAEPAVAAIAAERPGASGPVVMFEPRPVALVQRSAAEPAVLAATGCGQAVAGEMRVLQTAPAEVVVSAEAVAEPGG